MKNKVFAALAATMAVSAACAFAANPFVDVPADSWAYKSVVELADAGIIQGVDGQYFQGGRNITRYEAAEMVAKAMAHMDRASVEQRALINKLADEYAEELNNLGVRVAALENKVGNVKLTGDARLRYKYQKEGIEKDASWDYRVRLRATADVNDKTTVTYGLSTNNHNFGSNKLASSDTSIYTDMAKIDTRLGSHLTASVGRDASYVLGGGYGYQYGDAFDRVQLKYDNGRFAATVGYGKFKENTSVPLYVMNAVQNGVYAEAMRRGASPDMAEAYAQHAGVSHYGLNNAKTGYMQLEGKFGKGSALGVYYNSFHGQADIARAHVRITPFHDGASGAKWTEADQRAFETTAASKDATAIAQAIAPDKLWGAYVSYNFGSKWNALFDYQKLSHVGDVDDSKVWVGRLTYGKASMAAPKSWDAWVEYLNADAFSSFGSTNSWRFTDLDNVRSWGVGIDYTFAKNSQFQLMQSFGTKVKDGLYGDETNEQTRAQFVFAF